MKKTSCRIVSVLFAALLPFSFSACQEQTESVSDDIVVLFTNDVHCAIDGDIGYAGLASYVKYMESQTPYVTLVDCGDAILGDSIGTLSKGEYIVDIMNSVGYDYAVLGNHEFDYGMEQLSDLIEKSNAQYLGCNLTYTGGGTNALEDVLPYQIAEYGEVKVGFIGVSTPDSTTTSTPSYFMENGEYVYGFCGGNNGEDLYDCVQRNVDACRSSGADYVVLLTHLGDEEDSYTYSATELLQNTNGVDACLDGHAHNEIPCRVVQNEKGNNVSLASTGTGLANIGQLVITKDGSVSVGIISDYRLKDAAVSSYIEDIQAKLEEDTQKVVATSDIALSGYSADGIRLVRNRETTIGNFCADAYRSVVGADVAIVNGGAIRADLPSGNITYADVLKLHPYGNMLCVVKASGQEIIDALEMASRNVKNVVSENGVAVGELGGFLQVSGLKYTIDTSVEPSVEIDGMGMFVSVGDTRRVKDVFILGANGEYAPIDPSAIYTVASHNYLLKSGGDGLNMFMDNELLVDEGIIDNQVIITYLTEHLSGALGSKYSATEGRITVQ